MLKLIPWEGAAELLQSQAFTVHTETVPLEEAQDRVLAEEIRAALSAGNVQMLISRRPATLLIVQPLHQASGSLYSYPSSGISMETDRPSTRPAFIAS